MNTAEIKNLELARTTLDRVMGRSQGLPGLAVMYGPAGFGKSTAALVVANETRGYYVAIRNAWSRKAFLQKVLGEMGIQAEGTLPQMLDQVCDQLAASHRPLILDEFDYALRTNGMLELVRDIYEGAQQPLFLLGEELLPKKLEKWERFYSRVLAWLPAQPVSFEDVRLLAGIYTPDIHIEDDLLTKVRHAASGSVRRVVVNLDGIRETAEMEGWKAVSLKEWGSKPLFNGQAPMKGL